MLSLGQRSGSTTLQHPPIFHLCTMPLSEHFRRSLPCLTSVYLTVDALQASHTSRG
jgi:hypothetical protein